MLKRADFKGNVIDLLTLGEDLYLFRFKNDIKLLKIPQYYIYTLDMPIDKATALSS